MVFWIELNPVTMGLIEVIGTPSDFGCEWDYHQGWVEHSSFYNLKIWWLCDFLCFSGAKQVTRMQMATSSVSTQFAKSTSHRSTTGFERRISHAVMRIGYTSRWSSPWGNARNIPILVDCNSAKSRSSCCTTRRIRTSPTPCDPRGTKTPTDM